MGWIDQYQRKRTTAEEAVKCIKSGHRVFVHPGCCTPEHLLTAMVARKDELENVEVCHILTSGKAGYIEPGMEGHFRHRSFFTGSNVRQAVNDGRADQMHIFLHEIEDLYLTGQLPIDVALIQVSPPDEHGFLSYGVGVEVTMSAAQVARVVIAQVNPEMPRVHGDCFIHISKITYVVEHSAPLIEMPQGEIDEVSRKIGQHVADRIEDGSTLQMGIGAIPDAFLNALEGRRDMGIHTELFSDGIIPLVESGVINNSRKTLHPGKVVAAFALGTKKIFDFCHDNPIIEFHPCRYTNNPFIIAQNDRMVSVNSALGIDLTGQVFADSLGFMFYSGFGGQVDFVRGAAKSKGGRPFIAFPATAKRGTVTRIVPFIPPGTGVTTSRADVHWVVTEYGAANLHGKSVRERTRDLIALADPQFRDELEKFAREKKYI
ncbi:MAG: 4-hydroxybutyrate CoA-transferase [candidate division Zixibacteria bacterium RBG_16_53_22]|nr:MAG: 4-hydroxybutyrate CoA-transferase [candidate division Zixibacteria bacterium RBG_16_53_22]